MPSPEAWAVLAGLRGQRGNVAGQETATARCRQIAARSAQCAPA
jgi:hypothetical protein